MKNRKMKKDYNTHAYLKHHHELLLDVCSVFTMKSSAFSSFECQRLVCSTQCRNHFAESEARLNDSREREQKKYDRRRFVTHHVCTQLWSKAERVTNERVGRSKRSDYFF